MRVGIVGAGIAGLAAARSLQSTGHSTVVFEKSSRVGGRIETRRIGDYVFDSGATSIAPRSMAIQKPMLEELDTSDLVPVLRPIYIHVGLRVSPGDRGKNAQPRYAYRSGNDVLPSLLARGVDVRLDTPVEEIVRHSPHRFSILDEDFDAIVLTPPIPQTSAILWSLGETRPFSNASYRSCLSVLLGFDLPPPAVPYHALLDPEQRHPLTWMSIETLKSPGRSPEGSTALVVQLSPSYSQSHYDRMDEAIVEDTLDYLVRLYGNAWNAPAVSEVRRWKYSQPDSVALFESVNGIESRVLIAGDGVMAGRVESAYESGARAARNLENQT